MSEWLVHLVEIPKIGNLPKSDFLSICQIYGQNVISKRDLFKQGDLAVFLPPDSILPMDPENPIVKHSGLEPGHCIEPRRFLGVFSNGMLIPADVCFSKNEIAEIEVGTHVAERLGITKYQNEGERLDTRGGDNEKDHGYMDRYTDIDPLQRWRHVLEEGEEVILTTKTHGCNARFTYREGKLWVGSHHYIKKEKLTEDGQEKCVWWEIAKRYKLEEKLKLLSEKLGHDKTVIYGEIYGQIQKGFFYDTDGKTNKLRLFDSKVETVYNNWDDTAKIAEFLGVETVPTLYRGPWSLDLEEKFADGTEELSGGKHIREGFVVKPVIERLHDRLGRVILKRVSNDYKLVIRKKK